MYFSYLNLPQLPDYFKEICYNNIKHIGVHPRLERTNSQRGEMNRATFIPEEVNTWLKQNIIIPIFKTVRKEQEINLLNVTKYTKNKDGKNHLDGSHTPHVDRERHFALNYYFDTGGDNSVTKWYSDYPIKGGVELAEARIEPYRWCLLYVNPIVHAVRHIEEGRNRIFLSVAFEADDITTFNSREYFKDFLIESSIIS